MDVFRQQKLVDQLASSMETPTSATTLPVLSNYTEESATLEDIAIIADAVSPEVAYKRICERRGLPVLTAVKKLLPIGEAAWESVTSLDLSLTYVGPKGIVPVLAMCHRFTKLKSLIARGNFLKNVSMLHLTRMATAHPSLELIDVSGNEGITWTGGMMLLQLITTNAGILSVDARGTSVPHELLEQIFQMCRNNSAVKLLKHNREMVAQGNMPQNLLSVQETHDRKLVAARSSPSGQKVERNTPPTSSKKGAAHVNQVEQESSNLTFPRRTPMVSLHYRSVSARALKPIFFRMCVAHAHPRDALIGGALELNRILGSYKRGEVLSPDYLSQLADRIPVGEVLSWEVFLVLIVIRSSRYDRYIVNDLRSVFEEFQVYLPLTDDTIVSRRGMDEYNLSPHLFGTNQEEDSDEEEDDPVVPVSQLRQVMMRIYDVVPSDEDVRSKMEYLGLTPEMVLEWDDFLLLFYDCGPITSDRALIDGTATKLPAPSTVFVP